MVSELTDILAYPFMRNAIYACVLASIACGIIGTLVVTNRLAFLAGGTSHAAYGGIGLAFHYHLPVLPCTIAFSVCAALLMGFLTLRQEAQPGAKDANLDASIGVLWAAGMAFGIILIELTPGYAGELMGFLFGSILSVPLEDIFLMAAFDAVLVLLLWFFYQGFWAVSLDKEFARARGLPVNALTLLIIALTAITVVILIRLVGLILVLALLTIAPSLARRMCITLHGTMILASGLSLFFCLAGIAISWLTDLSSGATIIAVATVCFLLSHVPGVRVRGS